MDKSLCKVCKLIKLRKQDGMYDHKNKKFVDENGWSWNGRICPVCELERVRNKMREKRSKKDG